MKKTLNNTLILLLSILLSSCVSTSKEIQIKDPYVREVPPNQTISASFMTIKNNTGSDIALLKVTSNIAKSIELHEHIHNNGLMQMRQVSKIIIPANGSKKLQPGGFHIMLFGLQRKIKAGEKVHLILEFDNGKKEKVSASVKKIMT